MDINELRAKLDGIDDGIVRLFCERMRVCADIADFKMRNDLPVHDPDREQRKLADVLDKTDADLRNYMGPLYMQIFGLCRMYQDMLISRLKNDEVAADAEQQIEKRMKNIVLIGMPGCGKTMVGRYLAKFTMRAFFDTDEIVESKAGKNIQRIFSEDGESAFRDLESATLREVSGELGCVIATGGGVVEREVNRGFLAQNCIVVFLDRALDELPKDGRPLSLLKGVEELYDERMPRYVDWSDYRIKACNGIIETVQAVIEMLEL